MRIVYLLICIYIGLFVSACTTITTIDTKPNEKPQHNPKKNPISVTVYTEKHPLPRMPYKILGKATISKYNLGGIKRQEASIHDGMRNLAASMGGDAVININRNDKIISGTVIAYENVTKKKLS